MIPALTRPSQMCDSGRSGSIAHARRNSVRAARWPSRVSLWKCHIPWRAIWFFVLSLEGRHPCVTASPLSLEVRAVFGEPRRMTSLVHVAILRDAAQGARLLRMTAVWAANAAHPEVSPRHCEPTGRRPAPPDDRLREAIQKAASKRLDCFVACAPRNDGEALVHVHLQAFLLDDGSELRCLRLDEIGKLLRCAVVGPRTHRSDIALCVLALQEDFYFLVEGIDDRRGRALRQENAEPGRDIEFGQFRRALAHGRNIRC